MVRRSQVYNTVLVSVFVQAEAVPLGIVSGVGWVASMQLGNGVVSELSLVEEKFRSMR